jgi:uroporphyrinogen decarboxylase
MMTPRERVLAAVARREPDRVPIDLGGTESSGMTGMAWHRLVRHLGWEVGPGPDVLEPFQQAVRIGPELRARFGIDTLALFPEPRGWKPGRLGDGSPCRMPAGWNEALRPDGSREVLGADGRTAARMPAGGFYFDPVAAPLASCTSAADLEEHRAAVECFDLPGFCDEPPAATAARARREHSPGGPAVVL